MIDLKGISFHESTVIAFCRKESIVDLELDSVFTNGLLSHFCIRVSGVTSVLIDGIPSNDDLMHADDGEVFTLELFENSFSLIVEWNGFSREMSLVKSYQVIGENVYLLEL